MVFSRDPFSQESDTLEHEDAAVEEDDGFEVEVSSLGPQLALPSMPLGPTLGIVGSLLAGSGFFLPWYSTVQFQNGQQVTLLNVQSGWTNALASFGTAGPTLNGVAGFVFVSLPLVMALVTLLAHSTWYREGISQRFPILLALSLASVIMGIFAIFSEVMYLYILLIGNRNLGTDGFHVDVGLPCLFFGYFGILAGTILMALTPQPAPKQ